MPEGLPLPWPFPWALPTPGAVIERHLNQQLAAQLTSAPLPAFWQSVAEQADNQCQKFGQRLPQVQEVQIYLVEAVSDSAGGTSVLTTAGAAFSVIYPPEFVFVLDVGLPGLVGGVISWNAYGYGDPGFPEKSPIVLRSLAGLSAAQIIFPNVVGSLIIGLNAGTSSTAAIDGLTQAGLRNVQVSNWFATAECAPFQEASVALQIEANVPFVKYAEVNPIQRLIDFSPGWTAKRLF